MWNKPTLKQLQRIPELYATERVKDKPIYMKFFIGGWTWYIAEIDHNNMDTMFGYVISPMTSEWGYVSLKEIMGISHFGMEVDRDLHTVTPERPKKLSLLLKEDGQKDEIDRLFEG